MRLKSCHYRGSEHIKRWRSKKHIRSNREAKQQVVLVGHKVPHHGDAILTLGAAKIPLFAPTRFSNISLGV